MVYIVAKGDTLATISKKVACREQDLLTINELRNPCVLTEGQTLWFPPYQLPKQVTGKKIYPVRYGDTLRGISERFLGAPYKWNSLAQLNQLQSEDQIFIGQQLILPSYANLPEPPLLYIEQKRGSFDQKQARHIPARSFFFIIADEIAPGSKKVVRKVIFPKDLQGNPELVKQIIRPDKYGFKPRDPTSSVSIGRHVLGRTDSRYISASTLSSGSPRFDGKPYYINTKRLYSSGAVIHDAEAISKDLDRILSKTKDPKFRQYIEDIRHKLLVVDKEVLIEGKVPAGAIKSGGCKALTHGIQFVTAVGVIWSVYDLSVATNQSIEQGSIKPLAAESVRQTGGWGGAIAGAEIGTSLGAMVGISTGPGAVLVAAAGGLIFGMAGYFGANWVADYISEY